MRTPLETIGEFVAAFTAAWPTGDASDLGRFFSEDASYVNGPLDPIEGREAIVATLAQTMTLGGEVDVDILHTVSDGPVVMTERVDYWKDVGRTASLRVAGIFEVHDGLITEWRDYFDTGEFGSESAESG